MTTQQTRTRGGRFGRATSPEPITVPAEPAPVETPVPPPVRNTLAGVVYERPPVTRVQVQLRRADHAGGLSIGGSLWADLLIGAVQHGWQPAAARRLATLRTESGGIEWGALPQPIEPLLAPDGHPDLGAYMMPGAVILAEDAAALGRAIEAALTPADRCSDPFSVQREPVVPLLCVAGEAGVNIYIN